MITQARKRLILDDISRCTLENLYIDHVDAEFYKLPIEYQTKENKESYGFIMSMGLDAYAIMIREINLARSL